MFHDPINLSFAATFVISNIVCRNTSSEIKCYSYHYIHPAFKQLIFQKLFQMESTAVT